MKRKRVWAFFASFGAGSNLMSALDAGAVGETGLMAISLVGFLCCLFGAAAFFSDLEAKP